MKTVFIINPKAGQGKNIEKIISIIQKTASSLKAEIEIYITKAVGDAEKFVRNFCKQNGPARFIACGGDGTLSEVLNGAMESEDAEIGVIPSGTGNDFCRNFCEDTTFSDVTAQITSESIKCDAIKYTTTINGGQTGGYCVNMFNSGFECNVADMTQVMKKKPLISGSLAYFLSILATLIKKKGADLKVELDGKEVHNGALLLTSVANGCFCGGGIKSNPLACVQDGLINVNIIRDVPRRVFITLLPLYMKGTFLKKKGIEKIISSVKCRKMTITPNKDSVIRICIDGEITDAGKTEFEIVPGAFNFVVPKKIAEQGETKVTPELSRV